MNLNRLRTSGNRLHRVGASTLLAAVGLLTVGIAGTAGAAPPAAASPAAALQPVTAIPVRPPPGASTAPSGGPLINHGGPVQTSPVLYVVFWDWTSDPNGEMPYLTRFLSSI